MGSYYHLAKMLPKNEPLFKEDFYQIITYDDGVRTVVVVYVGRFFLQILCYVLPPSVSCDISGEITRAWGGTRQGKVYFRQENRGL